VVLSKAEQQERVRDKSRIEYLERRLGVARTEREKLRRLVELLADRFGICDGDMDSLRLKVDREVAYGEAEGEQL
jgi:hypothetical protein